MTGSVLFIIAAYGYWMVDYVITDTRGSIKSEKRGLLTIPTSGWEYWDGEKWSDDDTLKFIYKLK